MRIQVKHISNIFVVFAALSAVSGVIGFVMIFVTKGGVFLGMPIALSSLLSSALFFALSEGLHLLNETRNATVKTYELNCKYYEEVTGKKCLDGSSEVSEHSLMSPPLKKKGKWHRD